MDFVRAWEVLDVYGTSFISVTKLSTLLMLVRASPCRALGTCVRCALDGAQGQRCTD